MILTCASAGEAVGAAADCLAEAVASQPDLVLGLPTGRTMIPLYAELAQRYRSARLDLSCARAFNLDEILLPPAHPASFARYMEEHAWERIGLVRAKCEIPRSGGNPAAECRRYEATLEEAGGLDLAILGLGEDGHVAYNLPGPPHEETHVVEVPGHVADQLAIPASDRPLRAITLGFGALRRARQLLLLATGAAKARAIRALRESPETETWPCTLLRRHPRLTVIVDGEAGGAEGRGRSERLES